MISLDFRRQRTRLKSTLLRHWGWRATSGISESHQRESFSTVPLEREKQCWPKPLPIRRVLPLSLLTQPLLPVNGKATQKRWSESFLWWPGSTPRLSCSLMRSTPSCPRDPTLSTNRTEKSKSNSLLRLMELPNRNWIRMIRNRFLFWLPQTGPGTWTRQYWEDLVSEYTSLYQMRSQEEGCFSSNFKMQSLRKISIGTRSLPEHICITLMI